MLFMMGPCPGPTSYQADSLGFVRGERAQSYQADSLGFIRGERDCVATMWVYVGPWPWAQSHQADSLGFIRRVRHCVGTMWVYEGLSASSDDHTIFQMSRFLNIKVFPDYYYFPGV